MVVSVSRDPFNVHILFAESMKTAAKVNKKTSLVNIQRALELIGML
jgi:hypothetical protein